MDASEKLAMLTESAEESRRLALDEIDARARKSSAWGEPSHRQARERVESAHDGRVLQLQMLSEDELDLELVGLVPRSRN